jgi:hypothetical protein
MDSSQRTKLIIGGIVIVVLAAAAIYVYSDQLFGGPEKPTPIATAPAGGNGTPAEPPTTGVSGGKAIGPKR